MKIKIMVAGAAGKMGQEVCRAVNADPGLQLIAAFDSNGLASGMDVGDGEKAVLIANDQAGSLASKPQVMIDFTTPATVKHNVMTAIKAGVHCVVGTTGLTDVDLKELGDAASTYKVNVLVAPNFAIGAILMMEMAKTASRFFESAEIIELHHDQKADAPSGTALKTAAGIVGRGDQARLQPGEKETVTGARGGVVNGVHIHSVRLPGLVAHQEVIFGGIGQTLTIRHDAIDRTSFMPGVILAVKAVINHPGLTFGLEHYLDL